MAQNKDGRTFGIPHCRRLTWDLLYFNQSVPLCAHDRLCDLSALASARSAAPARISWPALFLKAYGLVAAEFPELRQTWYRWPFGHIYQHPESVASLAVQRQYKGAPWLFWARIPAPEQKPLLEIQECIDAFQQDSVPGMFRQEIRLARLPTILRRAIWAWNIHIGKAARAARLGTFFLSTLSGMGAEIQLPPAIQTGCLTYGPANKKGVTRVTLAYDHRLMDGALVADILSHLESVLSETLRREVLKPDSVNRTIRKVA